MTTEELNPSKEIVVYSTVWCLDCKRAKRFLGEERMPYRKVGRARDLEIWDLQGGPR